MLFGELSFILERKIFKNESLEISFLQNLRTLKVTTKFYQLSYFFLKIFFILHFCLFSKKTKLFRFFRICKSIRTLPFNIDKQNAWKKSITEESKSQIENGSLDVLKNMLNSKPNSKTNQKM